jgi:hypothetical protein
MNLEFTASGAFRDRVGARKDLLEAVKSALRLKPQGMAIGTTRYHYEKVPFEGKELAVIFRRTLNRIGLYQIYLLPDERHLFESRIERIVKEEPHD